MSDNKKRIMDMMIGMSVLFLGIAVIWAGAAFLKMDGESDLWAMFRFAFLGLLIGAYPIYIHLKHGDWNAESRKDI